MDSSTDSHERTLGFGIYSNSKVLSDITIRYGESGELKFEAHRILLSARSYWFQVAFTGGFAESTAREITLVGDDPEALKVMLDYAYNPRKLPLKDVLSEYNDIINIRYFLELYRVADKYNFPAFRAEVICRFTSCMETWVDLDDEDTSEDSSKCREFSDVVRSVYDLVGSERKPKHSLIKVLMEVADKLDPASVFNNAGSRRPLIKMASQEVAEFGRDILLRMMKVTAKEITGKKSEFIRTVLYVGFMVKCPYCNGEWWTVMRPEPSRWQGDCQGCGRRISDLREAIIRDRRASDGRFVL